MKSIFFIVVILLSGVTYAQEVIQTNKLNNSQFKNQHTRFQKYQIFELPTNSISQKVSHQNNSNSELKMHFQDLGFFDMQLLAKNILADTYFMKERTANGDIMHTINKCISYYGRLKNDLNSLVSLTIDDNFFYGFIRTNGKEYYFEPMQYFDKSASASAYIAYEKTDVIIDPNLKCAVTESNTAGENYRPTAGTGCFITEIAIASDATMFTRYGSALAVQNHNIGVMNNVQTDYLNNAFNDNIEFRIVTQNISSTFATDQLSPNTATTNCYTVLPNFLAWGNAGNFGVSYDIASLWSTRNFDDNGAGNNNGIIGLAYVGVVCGSSRYQILEDFTGSNPTGSGFQLRVLTSHETGHNFNLSHDGSGTPFIMAPSVQSTNIWSPTSISTANTYISGLSPACKNTCAVGLPITDFTFSASSVCIGSSINFTDYTFGGPTSWSWTFQDGSPATSTIRNPVVSFSSAGVKAITLTATNSFGSVNRTKSILVTSAPTAGCGVSGTNTTNGGIRGFSLQNISNTTSLPSGQAGAVYNDYSCSQVANLNLSTTYSGSVTVGTTIPANAFNHQEIYIDYNNDGDFIDAGELVYTSGGSANIGTVGFSFTTPSSGVSFNSLLRMRVVARTFGQAATSCPGAPAMSGAEVEDYGVSFPIILPSNDLNFSGYINNFNQAVLNWSLPFGQQFLKYQLEKSSNGTNFATISTDLVNNRVNFSITDPVTIQSANFYRVLLTKMDGTTTFSNIIKLNVNNTNKKLLEAVLPNPFTNQLQIRLNTATTENIIFNLFNAQGKLIVNEQSKIPQGSSTHTLSNLANLPKGNYMLQIITSTETKTLKLNKD